MLTRRQRGGDFPLPHPPAKYPPASPLFYLAKLGTLDLQRSCKPLEISQLLAGERKANEKPPCPRSYLWEKLVSTSKR